MTTQKLPSGRQIKKTDFILNAYDKAFDKGFQLTLEYKKKFGKPNAPQRYKTPDGYNLGEWQKTQKKNYQKGVLAQDRAKMLDGIGFKWGITGLQVKEQWDFWYALTLKYRNENDTPNAPTKYMTPDGYKLGLWQVRQRELYSKKHLSVDRVKRLKDIGFVWNNFDEQYVKGFQKTLEFKKQYGTPNALKKYRTFDGYNLGKWQSRQRAHYKKGKLSQNRKKRLEALGFIWNKRDEQFEKGFQKTLELKKQCGNPNVPFSYKTSDGYPLGQWQSNQRAGYSRGELSKERIDRLEEIGFFWIKRDERFEKGFQKTLDLKKQHGNPNATLNYKTHDGFRLGRWQSEQNKNYYNENISQERIKRLEEIGFIWRRQITNEERFEKGFQSTLEYKEQFGKPDAPLRYKTPDGYGLGAWQCKQRMDYKKGKLSAERVKRLDRIGLKWSLRKSRKKLL